MRAISGTELDLVVRGGTVVTSGTSSECDLGISSRKVVQMGGSLRGQTEIDASGALVVPGGVDMHVHLSLPSLPAQGVPAWVDEVYGWPRFTVNRGNVVFADGDVVAEPGRGQWLRRDATVAAELTGTLDL